MAWSSAILIVLGLILVGLMLYWQLIIAEGTYLGPRVVVLLYDWSASIYERIKQFNVSDEQWFLGLPLVRALERIPAPLVLDVATGTGRLPRAILSQPAFHGQIIGLDLSRRMLHEAIERTTQFADQLTYIWQDARKLPFEDDTFDAVTCLEALEFMPKPREVLTEMVRVLRPGGVLLVTNRIGSDARFLPRRAFPRDEFQHILGEFPLEAIKVRPWQTNYDLAWAIKTGEPRGGSVRPLSEILRCPTCNQRLSQDVADGTPGFCCMGCACTYTIAEDNVIEMAHHYNHRTKC